MSYSRWNPSDWYVFWLAEDDDKGDPYLEMWFSKNEPLVDCIQFGARYSVLKDITEDALAALLPHAPRASIPELLTYVREFCVDVASERASTILTPP